MAVVCVDPDAYADAGALMATVADQLTQAVSTLVSALGGSGAMAGSDSSGTTWAAGYDRGARAALDGAAAAVGAAGNVALRLHATGANHAQADGASTSGPGDSSFPAAPATPSKPTVSVPSAAGGSSGGEPTGWSLVSGLIGHAWPNGHQDQLRAAADAWRTGATNLSAATDPVDSAAAKAAAQDSPEAPAAAATCRELAGTVPGLVAVLERLGSASSDYADQLDAAHHAVTTALVEMLAAVAATQVVGAAVAFFTAGVAEAPTQAVAGGEVDAFAADIDVTLGVLATEAATSAGEAETVAASAESLGTELGSIEEGSVQQAATADSTGAGASSSDLGSVLSRDDLNPSQQSNLTRYEKKLPAGAEPTVITRGGDGTVQLSSKVPGRVPGSYATYEKVIDESGTTVGYTKTTVAPDGTVIHVKDKMGP